MTLSLPKSLLALFSLGLLLAIFASALMLIVVRYENRQLFSQLDRLERQRDGLQIEWQQLQLEHSVWAKPARIERVARAQLHMRFPTPTDIIPLSLQP